MDEFIESTIKNDDVFDLLSIAVFPADVEKLYSDDCGQVRVRISMPANWRKLKYRNRRHADAVSPGNVYEIYVDEMQRIRIRQTTVFWEMIPDVSETYYLENGEEMRWDGRNLY